jgi:hypothetical protein
MATHARTAKGAPRGRESSRIAVDIWDVCYRADRPLTIDEIANELKSRGRQFITDAMLLYKERRPELASLWTNESPPAEVLDVAWREYVTQSVRAQCQLKQLKSTRGPGGNTASSGPYMVNHDRPPMVYRNSVTIDRKLVPYDPEYRDQANQAQSAGMEFLAKVEAPDIAKRRLPAEVRELLDLAITAIRAKQASA